MLELQIQYFCLAVETNAAGRALFQGIDSQLEDLSIRLQLFVRDLLEPSTYNPVPFLIQSLAGRKRAQEISEPHAFPNDRPNVSSVDWIFAMEPSLVTGTFKTEPGRHLFFRRWIPDCPSKGMIVIAHGLGEHSGRYMHVGDFFARAGFTAFAFDLRGHGSSEGKAIFIRRYKDYLDDLESAFTHLSRPEPLILFGHRLGGQLVLAYAQSGKRAPAGYIAASPWLGL